MAVNILIKLTLSFLSVVLVCLLLQDTVEARASPRSIKRPDIISLPDTRFDRPGKRYIRWNDAFPFEAETDNSSDVEPPNREDDVIWINRGPAKRADSERGNLDRKTRQLSNTQNIIELLLAVDNKAFEKYRERNNGNTQAAAEEIRRYYAGIIKAVNDRFAKMDAGSFSIRVALTRVLTLTSPSRFFTKGMDDDDNDGNINGYEALSRLEEFSRLVRNIYPHDYLLAMTGYDLRTPGGGNLVGVTYGDGICTRFKQGIAEDDGDEQMALTVAHEIAHSVGAGHDQQSNSCPNNFFTMMPNTGVPRERSQAGNPFTFTSCSKTEIRSFVAGNEAFCLRTRSSSSEVNLAQQTSVPLGQIYDADSQCVNTFGNGSFFCRNLYNNEDLTLADDMCYRMLCFAPGTNYCYFTLSFFGTSCGNGRWCKDGLCVTDSRAPATF